MITRTAPHLRTLLLATALTLTAPMAAAQQACDCAVPFFPARWSVFVSTGGGTFTVDGINGVLATGGFAAVSNDAIGFGGGGFGSFGPLRIGAEHVRLDGGSETTPAGLSARIEASYTTLTDRKSVV